VVNITVNRENQKRNPVSGVYSGEAIAFSPKQRNRVSTVNITVNCESEKETRFLGFLKEAIAFLGAIAFVRLKS
jgi:hypothetical protein